MIAMWKRDWSLRIGTLLIQPGDGFSATVEFDVVKTLGREPNTATIRVANLSDDRIAQLSGLDDPDIDLRAGYRGAAENIFAGDAQDIWTVTEKPDRWTHIEARDGGRSYRTAVLGRAFPAGSSVASVIIACARAMEVGIGNATAIAATAELDTGGRIYATGTTVSGPAWRSLDRVCSSCSLRWSVQQGVLQLRRAGRPADVSAVLLSPATGLLGSPSRGQKDRRGKVTYTAASLMRPGVYPGRVVRIESRDLRADLLCKRTQHSGSTTGNDWSVTMELAEYA